MVLVHNYALAVFFFVIAITCWVSWANTQKLAAKNWRFELFYWDVVIVQWRIEKGIRKLFTMPPVVTSEVRSPHLIF
jgi:hypothetical protein